MSDALLIPIAAVSTGVVVIVVAVAVVLVVLFVTLSMRGLKRGAETREDLAEAHERAARAERDRDVAQEQAQQRTDPDR
jgi:predicted Holliday junction resolvase-like endonuclease